MVSTLQDSKCNHVASRYSAIPHGAPLLLKHVLPNISRRILEFDLGIHHDDSAEHCSAVLARCYTVIGGLRGRGFKHREILRPSFQDNS